jgi:transcription elongation factor GreA
LEIEQMAVVAIDRQPANGGWPMTAQAYAQLEAEAARLSRAVVEQNGYVTGHLDGEADAPNFVPNIVGQQIRRQLERIRSVLEVSEVVDTGGMAVIGREIVLREADGLTSRYELVIPGDGNLASGLVSADSPVGIAVLGRRVGDRITVAAPAGSWTATLVEVS